MLKQLQVVEREIEAKTADKERLVGLSGRPAGEALQADYVLLMSCTETATPCTDAP